MGEGTIIVRDASTGLSTGGTSIGLPDTYDGLKRDVTLAQYNTKEGGLSGGFTVDDNLVQLIRHPIETPVDSVLQIYQGLIDAKDTTVLIYNEAGEVIENTGNWIEFDHYVSDDKLKYYQTMDEYEALKASGGEVTPLDTLIYYKSKVAAGEELTQEEIDEYAKVSVIVKNEANKQIEAMNDSELVKKLKEKGIDIKCDGSGNALITNPINQHSMGTKYDNYLCAFLSTLGMGRALAGETPFTLEEAKEKYKEAVKAGYIDENGSVWDYDGVLKLGGADYALSSEPNNFNRPVSDHEIDINSRMINDLNNGQPVLIHLNSGTDDKHKEYVTDYTKIDGKIYYKLNDSGNCKDVYMSADTFEVYHKNDDDELEVTKLKSGAVRKATNVSFVTPKEDKTSKSKTKETASK